MQINLDGGSKSFSTVKNGLENGVVRFFDEKGRLIGENLYLNGMRNGYRRTYNEYGSLSVEIIFENDKPISGKCYWGRGEGRGLTMNNAQIFNWLHYATIKCR
ncbi:hypothetical protein AGMMS49941_10890 [Deferribacterales bacterium]|nr:hypothetical protein AGMMS49941_10890 [Deferribacterales bacterium]